MRPTIGVTTSRKGGRRSFILNQLALWRAGARAVRIVGGGPVPSVQGLVIGGGDDIGAEHYGGTVLPDVRVDPERDALELSLLARTLPTSMPLLGICRGAQMINVALGGTLYTDIRDVYENTPQLRTVLPRKRVVIDEQSRLAGILRCNPCMVNALHHQSVDRLGANLRIVGRDQFGIVQALEGTTERFLVGVQWHPEMLVFSRSQQRLFLALAMAARQA
jgi:putative glutamine amidotransferase